MRHPLTATGMPQPAMRRGPAMLRTSLGATDRRGTIGFARLVLAGAALVCLAACDPAPGGSAAGKDAASQAEYERHKANRQSYMYQGY